MAIMTPRQKHNEEPPEVVIAAMKAADICIMPTTYAISHTQAAQAALKAGAKLMIHREITEDTFTNGAITADYEEVHALTERIAARYEKGTEVRMTTAAGTDIVMTKKRAAGAPTRRTPPRRYESGRSADR
jgi:leucyl aminopeptidase (aminopeptidase T)